MAAVDWRVGKAVAGNAATAAIRAIVKCSELPVVTPSDTLHANMECRFLHNLDALG